MALTAFKKIQFGRETTRGTAVSAGKALHGTLRATPGITHHRPVDDRGSLAEYSRSVAVAQRTGLRWEGDASYESIIHFLAMALKGGVTPSTPDGATNTRRWTFKPNLTARNNQNAYTFEYGDDTQVWRNPFSMVQNLELTASLDSVVNQRADMFGQLAEKRDNFTATPTILPITEIVANKGKVWIDGVWGNLGTTLKSSLIAGATIRFPTGLTPVKYMDGSLDFSGFSEQRRHFELDLDLIMSDAAITEYDAYIAGTTRAVRVLFEGPIIEGALPYRLQLDMTGEYSREPELLDDRDGESMFRLTLSSQEDADGEEFEAVVDNTETAL